MGAPFGAKKARNARQMAFFVFIARGFCGGAVAELPCVGQICPLGGCP